jgi:F420-dependent oxidoreductase-like protein
MRFGLVIPQGWRLDLAGIEPAAQWPVMLEIARTAEAGPFESVWVYDHFHTVPVPTHEATHEAWSLMAALAASTSRVRLGQMCTCVSYRNPAYLAKVAATVDIVSDGRLEVGIGAGWYEPEWRAYGYGFPAAGERIARLDEGVQIMRQLWKTGTATFHGQHFQVDGAICQPLPVQADGISLWIAGGGEKKTLRIAARYAAYTNFDGSPEGFRRKSQVLAGHCAELSRDFDSIVRSTEYNVVVGATESEVQDRLDWFRSHYAPFVHGDELENACRGLASGLLVGTPERIAERLAGMTALGLKYAILYFPEVAYDRSGLDLFAREVAPALAGDHW